MDGGARPSRARRPGDRRRVRPYGRPRRDRQHGSDGTDLARPNGALVVPLYGHTGLVDDVSFGPGGIVVTASGDETARTWVANGRPIQVLRGHTGAVVAAAFARRDVVVTAGADGTIRLWDPGTIVELVRRRVDGAASAVEAARRAQGRLGGGGRHRRSPADARRRADAPRPYGPRQHGRVQPGRTAPGLRRARPRRHRLGRRERRDRPSLHGGTLGVRRGCSLQPGRAVDRDGGTEVGPPVERGRRTRR